MGETREFGGYQWEFKGDSHTSHELLRYIAFEFHED